ncbi:hypothetical protein LLG96_04930 [bacterium]|nr:hypothetical protein [bacterium]
MSVMTFQILDCSISVDSQSPEIQDRLNDIAVEKDHGPVRHTFVFTVNSEGDGYRILFNDLRSPLFSSAVQTVLNLHEWFYSLVLFHHRDELCIHAGCFSFDGSLGILSGEKNAGKTSILCSLAMQGADVFGDEYILVKNGSFRPVPRKFHLKEKTLDIVPGLKSACAELTPYPSHYGGMFYFYDPAISWEQRTPVRNGSERIFFINPHHGGKPAISACSQTEMVENLLTQILNPGIKSADIIKELCIFVSQRSCYTIYSGNMEIITELLTKTPEPDQADRGGLPCRMIL